MAKLTLRQKENIKALYDTGNYSKNSLAKKYKVDEKTVRRIVGKEPPKHKELVEDIVSVEVRKKAELKPSEIRAIDCVVQERLKVDEISTLLLDKMKNHIQNGKAQKVVTTGAGNGVSNVEIVEHDLQADDYKKLADAVDKISVTTGVNERFSQSQVNIQNNNQNNQQNDIETNGITVKRWSDR